jgi:hypothetical protein
MVFYSSNSVNEFAVKLVVALYHGFAYKLHNIHCKNSKARLPPKHGSDAVAIESVLVSKKPHGFECNSVTAMFMW